MSMDSFEDDTSSNFRQRLWGAVVFIAIMVILLPLLLDGAGSESQFKRVEQLRQEPPSVIDRQGNLTISQVPEMRALEPLAQSSVAISERRPTRYEGEVANSQQSRSTASLTAWVVQAGSFRDESNALMVRDRLREAGFASFVRDRESVTEPFRVLVGPMITQQSATAARDNIVNQFGGDALVFSYP